MMQRLQRILHFYVLTCFGSHVFGSVIIHGEKAPVGSMLYMVSVQNRNGHVCGGFLISEDYVLTAAHCYNGTNVVVLGTHNLHKYRRRIKIASKCLHPDFIDVGLGNDLMLLKLSTKAKMGNGVKTIRIPQHDTNLNQHQKCQVAGWGSTRTGGSTSDDLMVVDVSIIDPQVCNQVWGRWIRLPANVICAGGSDTKGFCQGDSGGPLVCNGIAVGIVSFNKDGNCKYPDVPNVYTDISKYRTWISKMIGETEQST